MAGRKKLDRTNLHARVAAETPEKLKNIALALGYLYDNQGSTGQLLDAIANGEIVLVRADGSQKVESKRRLYFVEIIFPNEVFLKIGITGLSLSQRFSSKKYSVRLIHQVEGVLSEVLEKEQFVLRKFAQFAYRPGNEFMGHTECFTNDIPISEVVDFMDR